MEVQHDEFVRIPVEKLQQRVDQLLEVTTGAEAIVVKVELRFGALRVTETDIESPGAVSQLPGKRIVLAACPVTHHGILAGCLFVHTGIVCTGPDNIGEF
ncbi:hypothetical protein D3C87_1021200 [compost metagenome]